MPLRRTRSRNPRVRRRAISSNVRAEMHAGRPQRQAVAIALSVDRASHRRRRKRRPRGR